MPLASGQVLCAYLTVNNNMADTIAELGRATFQAYLYQKRYNCLLVSQKLVGEPSDYNPWIRTDIFVEDRLLNRVKNAKNLIVFVEYKYARSRITGRILEIPEEPIEI